MAAAKPPDRACLLPVLLHRGRYMDKRQAAMQAAQQELVRERRAQLGGVPDRTQDILVIKVGGALPGSWQLADAAAAAAAVGAEGCDTCATCAGQHHFNSFAGNHCSALPAARMQVGEVAHAALVDARPGGQEGWRPATALIT